MVPFVSDPDFTLLNCDVLEGLRSLPDESVHCVLTSPPYWGLRDYGTGTWEGGDAECEHKPSYKNDQANREKHTQQGEHGSAFRSSERYLTQRGQYSDVCGRCGARRIDNQLGLEPTPEQYVARMVEVFREVRRVLRADGTCWINLGDSYASGEVGRNGAPDKAPGLALTQKPRAERRLKQTTGLKQKDLCGVPWRLAFALQQPYYTGRIKDERDRIWLAATIEAEGCLFIHKRGEGQYASSYTRKDGSEVDYHRKNATYGSGLEVSSTDRVIVERCLEIAGIGSVCEQSPAQNDRRKQTLYRWNLRTNECRDVVRELYPHLIAKQHEARLLIGCPSSGENARKAHESLKAIHQGLTPCIDFQPPEGMFERGWFLRSEIIWAKLCRIPCPNP